MNEKLGESLSALMDGEAGAADMERVLDNVRDPALRESWRRYHNVRHSLGPGSQMPELDLSDRIMAAIERESAHGSEASHAAGTAVPGPAATANLDEQLGESLSALIDGEAGDADIARVLDNASDPALRESWRRYHSVRSGLEPGSPMMNLDLSDRIMAAVEQEPSYDMVPTPAANETEPGAAAASIQPVGRFQQIMKPVASFAVAASVTAAVLLGSQYYGLLETGAPVAPVADAVTERGSPVTLLGGTATRAGYGYAVPAQREAQPAAAEPAPAATDYDAIARERLRRYMLPHADEAALNSPQGMMPYAKVATFEAEE